MSIKDRKYQVEVNPQLRGLPIGPQVHDLSPVLASSFSSIANYMSVVGVYLEGVENPCVLAATLSSVDKRLNDELGIYSHRFLFLITNKLAKQVHIDAAFKRLLTLVKGESTFILVCNGKNPTPVSGGKPIPTPNDPYILSDNTGAKVRMDRTLHDLQVLPSRKLASPIFLPTGSLARPSSLRGRKTRIRVAPFGEPRITTSRGERLAWALGASAYADERKVNIILPYIDSPLWDTK